MLNFIEIKKEEKEVKEMLQAIQEKKALALKEYQESEIKRLSSKIGQTAKISFTSAKYQTFKKDVCEVHAISFLNNEDTCLLVSFPFGTDSERKYNISWKNISSYRSIVIGEEEKND
jgi:hypothetical protein